MKPILKFPSLKKLGGLIIKTFNDKIDTLKKAFFPLLLNINLVNIVGAEYLAFLIINRIVTKIINIKAINKLKKNKALRLNKILSKFLLKITIPFIKGSTYLF